MQQGPEVEMLAADNRIYVKARGSPGGEDSLASVAQCCHTQFMFLWNKEKAFVSMADVNVVRPE